MCELSYRKHNFLISNREMAAKVIDIKNAIKPTAKMYDVGFLNTFRNPKNLILLNLST